MAYYKDTNNNLHFLDSDEFEYLLPANCVAITEADAQAIQAEIEANKIKPIPLTPEEKLSKSGLTVDELKSLLGL